MELFCLSVLPGTDLYDRASELNLKFQSEPPYNIIETSHFSKEDVKKAAKISNACNIFYNQGRAVPWFNTICQCLKIKPAQFFIIFAQFLDQEKINIDCNSASHKEIEKLQKETGLDIRNFDDALTFKIALMVVSYLQYLDSRN